jgi:beta-phosphoglucomutase-like phosphatase (HAD superfamily)
LGASPVDVNAQRCLAVENSHDGWLAATNAGMGVAVVANEHPEWLNINTEMMPRFAASDILQSLKQRSV